MKFFLDLVLILKENLNFIFLSVVCARISQKRAAIEKRDGTWISASVCAGVLPLVVTISFSAKIFAGRWCLK